MNELERIDALLELDVLIGELGFVFGLAQLFLDHLLGALREGREASAICERRQDGVSQRSWTTAVHGGLGGCGGCKIGGRRGMAVQLT